MRAGAGADAARPFRVCEVFVGCHLAIGHAVAAGIDDAGARGQAEPAPVGVAEFGRDVGVQHGRGDGLHHACIDDLREAGDVHGHHQIGGAAVAFRDQAFDKALVDKGHVHVDAGLRGEGVEQGLDQFGLAVGIDVDLGGQRRGCGGKQGQDGAGEHS